MKKFALTLLISAVCMLAYVGPCFPQGQLRDPSDPDTFPPGSSLQDMVENYVPDLEGEIFFWETMAYPQYVIELNEINTFTWDMIDEVPLDHPNRAAILEETGKALDDWEMAWSNLDDDDPLSMYWLICAQAEHIIMEGHTIQARIDLDNEDYESCLSYCNKAYDEYAERLDDETVVLFYMDEAYDHNENALNLLLSY